MDRRMFVRAAGVCGGIGVAGCTDWGAETATESNGSDTFPRYNRPAYSEWPPAEGHDSDGLLFAQLRLGQYPAIQQAIDDGRLDSDHPAVGLGADGIERIATAVETLSAYPFGDTLREAVIGASSPDGQTGEDRNQTLVEPATDSLSPTDGSTRTEDDSITNESTDSTVGTESAETGNHSTETENQSTQNESTSAETENQSTSAERSEPVTAVDRGIELDRIALIDELLLFEGSFDRSRIIDRFGSAFEHVDTHRGVSIYEGSDESAGLAFALDGSRLLVPTADESRSADGETVLAHSLSGYINTVGRIIDTADGEWLFETTGSAALGVGFWETPVDDHLAESAVAPDRSGVDAVFGAVESCLSAITVSEASGPRPTFDARFSGLYPDGPPSDAELVSALGGEVDEETVYTEPPRAHITTPLGEQ